MSEQFGQELLQGAPQPDLADQGQHNEQESDCQGSHDHRWVIQGNLTFGNWVAANAAVRALKFTAGCPKRLARIAGSDQASL